MENKTFLVAVRKNGNGVCEKVYQVINATKTDYNTLINEQNYYLQKKAVEKQQLLNRIDLLEKQIELLVKEIKYLKGEDENEEESDN